MSVICGYRERGMWWVRIFGVGFSWEDHRIHPPLFSDRNGYIRRWHIGPYCLRILGRHRL